MNKFPPLQLYILPCLLQHFQDPLPNVLPWLLPVVTAICLTYKVQPVFSCLSHAVTCDIQRIIKKAREFQKNIYFCFIDYAKAFDCVAHKELWKILKEMGIPDHLTCLLRNLYAGHEATVRTGHGTTDWFQIRKGVHQGCILSPCLFNLYAEYIMRNTGLE